MTDYNDYIEDREPHVCAKQFLYMQGVRRAVRFCKVNKLPEPQFFTYDEAVNSNHRDAKLLQKLRRLAPIVGAATGLFQPPDFVFVNIQVTALPVQTPRMRSWSWPGWKTDRTAMGVVAHEMGHYVEQLISQGVVGNTGQGAEKQIKALGECWRSCIKDEGRKRVTSYEPVPSEAFAETMRLFILNPQLLKLAIPARYNYIRNILELKPSEKRLWRQVLRNPAYYAPGERWIAK